MHIHMITYELSQLVRKAICCEITLIRIFAHHFLLTTLTSVSHRMSTTIYCRLSIVGENYGAVTIDYGYRDVPGKIAIAGSVLKMHCSDTVSSI